MTMVRPAVPKLPPSMAVAASDRGLGGRADHDPLAGGQPVRLDHHGQALGADVGRIEICPP